MNSAIKRARDALFAFRPLLRISFFTLSAFVHTIDAQWVVTAWNRRIQFIGINLLTMSFGKSEYIERAKRAARSKRMSKRCERRSERTSEWPSSRRFHTRSAVNMDAFMNKDPTDG